MSVNISIDAIHPNASVQSPGHCSLANGFVYICFSVLALFLQLNVTQGQELTPANPAVEVSTEVPQSTNPSTATVNPDPVVVPNAPSELSLTTVQAFIPLIEKKAEWDAETQKRLKEIYSEILAQLNLEKQWQEKSINFDKLAQSAPVTLKDTQAEIATSVTQPATNFLENLTVAEIEPVQAQMEADLKAAQDRALEVDRDAKARSDRRVDIPKLKAKAKSDLEVAEQSALVATAAEMAFMNPVQAAETHRARSKKRALTEELISYDKEIASYDARKDLLVARQELATRRVTSLSNHLSRLREILSERRRREAEKAARQAEEDVKRAAREHEAVEKLAEENLILSRERVGENGMVVKINDSSQALSILTADLEKYISEYRSIRGKVGAIESMGPSVNNAIGLLLRKRRALLPEPRDYLRAIREQQDKASETQYKLVELREERSNYVDIESRVVQVMEQVTASDTDQRLTVLEKSFIEIAAREQLQNRRKYLDDLIADNENYSNILAELEVGRLKMVELLKHYANYIDERILWIRSSDRIGVKDFKQDWQELKSVFSVESIRLTFQKFTEDFKRNPTPTIAGALFAVVLLLFRSRLIQQLNELGAQAKKRTQVLFGVTWKALWITLALAATIPVILWIVAWRLEDSSFLQITKTYATSINRLAWGYFILALIRQVARNNGLAECHFGWSAASLKQVRFWVLTLMLVNLPILFLITALNQNGDSAAGGRILFMISMVMLIVFFLGLFHPNRSPLQLNAKGEESQDVFLWTPFLLGLAVPLALFLASAFGYHYTSMRMAGFLQNSIWLALGIYLLYRLIFRWLLVIRRRLAIEQARQKRLAAQSASATSSGSPTGGVNPESGAVTIPDEELDLSEANSQTLRLVGSVSWLVFALGLWGIWADIVPALGALDRVVVWPIRSAAEKSYSEFNNYDWLNDTSSVSSGDAVSGNADSTSGANSNPGSPASEENPTASNNIGAGSLLTGGTMASSPSNSKAQADAVVDQITLADLCVALIAIFMTYIGSRNIPGLLEITVVRWMKLDRGGSYAMTTLAQYVIILVGGLTAFGAMGMTWSKLQWFAAAISLGIGFGLQEIVSNFVSGIIVLFERPIRPGDVVTVGDISGTVSKIKIRATTITDWDRKELIVPNREFVTGRLINWTLTDPVTRVVFKVGAAYGTDPEKVRDVLLEVARTTPNVLADPAPSVVFQQFGDSSLDFNLRVFVPHIDYLITTRNDIQYAIDKAFKKAGIEIPFPQRDLHIKSMPPEFFKRESAPSKSGDKSVPELGDLEI